MVWTRSENAGLGVLADSWSPKWKNHSLFSKGHPWWGHQRSSAALAQRAIPYGDQPQSEGRHSVGKLSVNQQPCFSLLRGRPLQLWSPARQLPGKTYDPKLPSWQSHKRFLPPKHWCGFSPSSSRHAQSSNLQRKAHHWWEPIHSHKLWTPPPANPKLARPCRSAMQSAWPNQRYRLQTAL